MKGAVATTVSPNNIWSFRGRQSTTRHAGARTARRSVITWAAEKEARCYVNEEGHLVCDVIEPGDYVVKADDSSQSKEATAEDGVAFCYITDDGELICEGLEEGNYTIERASDEQMKEILNRMETLTTDDGSLTVPEPEPEVMEEEMKESFDPETGVHCYVNADGVMVCEKLEPGDYVVKQMPLDKSKLRGAEPKEVTFCYITDDGELICEGMEEGEYRIERATDDDLSEMLKHVESITQPGEGK